ncbi:hypothetical protein IGJ55_003225 [Enterococcus sp. AZ170]|uniref:ThiF family adenylyltransferase n=1 Tax=Enterococcus sp. AZ170 TaxID=2774747 RepID=UPI003D2FB2A1
MSNYYLNPFVFILEREGQTYINTPIGYNFFLTKEQEHYLSNNDVYRMEWASELFSEEEWAELIKNKCIISDEVDVAKQDSRTKAFFTSLNLEEQYEEIKMKHVLILGAGAIGSYLAWGLVTAGVKQLTIVDYDEVEASNLNRQLLYKQSDIGKLKIDALKQHLLDIDPSCEVEIINQKIDSKCDVDRLIEAKQFDLLVKGVDTPAEISEWVFDSAEEHRLAYTSGATIGINLMYGPSFIPGYSGSYKNIYLEGKPFYSEMKTTLITGKGVSANFAIGTVSAKILQESLKILLGLNELLIYNNKIVLEQALTNQIREAKIRKRGRNSMVLLLSLILTVVSFAIPGTNYLVLFFISFLVMILYRKKPVNVFKYAFACGAVSGGAIGLNLLVSLIGTNLEKPLSIASNLGFTLFSIVSAICLNVVLFCFVSGIFLYGNNKMNNWKGRI